MEMTIGQGMDVAEQTGHPQKGDCGVHHLQLVLTTLFLLKNNQHLPLTCDKLYISLLLDRHTLSFFCEQEGRINLA